MHLYSTSHIDICFPMQVAILFAHLAPSCRLAGGVTLAHICSYTVIRRLIYTTAVKMLTREISMTYNY